MSENLNNPRESLRESVLVGPLPPPHVGQSLSFKMLTAGYANRNLPYSIINLSGGSTDRRDGSFSLGRLFSLALPFLSAALLIFKPRRNLYLTIAQSWCGFLRDIIFIVPAKLAGYRIVLHLKGGNYGEFYNSLSDSRKRLVCKILSYADEILVLGECLIDMFSFLPNYKSKVKVVHNGLTIDEDSIKSEKQLPRQNQPLRILYLSNLFVTKGYLDVLEAVNIMRSKHDLNVEAHFCGQFLLESDCDSYSAPAEAEADFAKKVAEYNLQDSVKWLGTVSGDDKITELNEAHFLVLPSRYNNEGQPVCIVEAMAFGCVVLATEYRTIPEMLDYGKAGRFIKNGKPETIVDEIKSFAENPQDYSKFSINARARCQQLFTQQKHLDNLIAHITGGFACAE